MFFSILSSSSRFVLTKLNQPTNQKHKQKVLTAGGHREGRESRLPTCLLTAFHKKPLCVIAIQERLT